MRAHNHETRQEAIRRWQAGEKKSDISRALEVDYNTLLGWIKRFQSEGLAGLGVRYSGCGRKPASTGLVVERAKEMRKAHPDWGGGYIRLNLLRELPGEKVPGERQLQRQLAGAGLGVRRTKLPSVAADWATKAFERVQVDAKERLRTRDAKECCYLNFIDEYTGAELDSFVFPLRAHQPSPGWGSVRLCPVRALALGIHPLFQDGQRPALWGPDPPGTDAPELVPPGIRHVREAEPCPLAAQERQGGAQPGDHCPMGRPLTVCGLS